MERQGEPEAFRRDEALMALAELSVSHPSFLSDLRNDLESTLWRYGFALSPQEMREAREYLAANREMSDEEILERLRTLEARWW